MFLVIVILSFALCVKFDNRPHRIKFPDEVTFTEDQIDLIKISPSEVAQKAAANLEELWNQDPGRRQMPLPLPTPHEILLKIERLGKYEKTKLYEDGKHSKINKQFGRFWDRFKAEFPILSTKIIMEENTVAFKIDGYVNPAHINLFLRHVDEEPTDHETCEWPYGADAFDPQIITCQHPYSYGTEFIVLRTETTIELIAMAIALETLLSAGWLPKTTIMIGASETHHIMDGGTEEWMLDKEQDGDYQLMKYMQDNELFADSCIDEQSFHLPFYPLGDPLNPTFLPPALLIGTSQIGIDLYQIRIKGNYYADIALAVLDVINLYTDQGTNLNLFCDAANNENVIETLTAWIGMDPSLIPGLFDQVEKDALFKYAACESVITSFIHTNDYEHYDYADLKSPYDRELIDFLVQVTYNDQDPQHSQDLFIAKLQPLIDSGAIEVDMIYRRPNRAKASQMTMWYQSTSALLHALWDGTFPGVNVVPFTSPGAYDLYQYINGGVCQNGYSFHHMFMEFTCPEDPTMIPPPVNINSHGHGCGSMYSENQVNYMVQGNAANFMML